MNTKLTIKAFVFLILLSSSQIGYTKDYIVEMIFFANTRANSVHVSSNPSTPNYQNAIPLNDSAQSYGFIPLPSETYTLTNKVAALNSSGQYKVLKHVAWLQPGLAREDALPVIIHAGKNYRNEFQERTFVSGDFNDQNLAKSQHVNELDGTIKVVLGRYLHVYTDLVYRRPFSLSSDPASNPLGRDRLLADFPVKTHRKMRSKELHYIDHPLLGILVEIRPASS